jgi:hypothetical protein
LAWGWWPASSSTLLVRHPSPGEPFVVLEPSLPLPVVLLMLMQSPVAVGHRRARLRLPASSARFRAPLLHYDLSVSCAPLPFSYVSVLHHYFCFMRSRACFRHKMGPFPLLCSAPPGSHAHEHVHAARGRSASLHTSLHLMHAQHWSPHRIHPSPPRHCLCLFSVSFVSSLSLVHLLVQFRSDSKQPRPFSYHDPSSSQLGWISSFCS